MPSLVRRKLVALLSVSLTALGATALAPSASANGVIASPPNCSSTFSGGAGTDSDPYLMSNPQDLTDLNGCDNFWGNSFLQTADIDMESEEWLTTATGTSTSPFSGTYDGGGFVVTGLVIALDSTDDHVGLFGYVTGSIRNLGFVTWDLSTPTVRAGSAVGGLVGSLDGGSVLNSYARVNVYAEYDSAGGLVGSLDGGSVLNSYAIADVYADDNYAGGLVGDAVSGAVIEGSYASGVVEADDDYAGGLVGGLSDPTSVIRSSYSTASVTGGGGDEEAGGLVGILTDGRVQDSYSTGSVTGGDRVGGFIGHNDDGTVVRSFSTGSVSGTASSGNDVGGFIGISSGSVSDCYSTGSVVGGDAGGLIGDNIGTVTNSYAIGSITGVTTGGLVNTNTGTVTQSFWNLQTSGAATSSGGTGLPTEAMKERNTYVGADWSIADGFNAGSTWGICLIANNGYPYLSWTSPTSPCGPALTYEFTFSLPDGQECGPISPMAALAGVWVSLPPATADCTVDGATIIGWSVRGMDGHFQPGQQVLAVDAQQFTAVLSHSRVAVTSDANVAAADACMSADGNTALDQRVLIEEPGRDSLGSYRAPLAPTCTPEGVTFAGWDYRSAGVVLAPGDALPAVHSATNAVHLYAVWV